MGDIGNIIDTWRTIKIVFVAANKEMHEWHAMVRKPITMCTDLLTVYYDLCLRMMTGHTTQKEFPTD